MIELTLLVLAVLAVSAVVPDEVHLGQTVFGRHQAVVAFVKMHEQRGEHSSRCARFCVTLTDAVAFRFDRLAVKVEFSQAAGHVRIDLSRWIARSSETGAVFAVHLVIAHIAFDRFLAAEIVQNLHIVEFGGQ